MSFANYGSVRRLVGRFLGNERMRMGGIYLMLTEEYKGGFLVMKKH